MIFVAFIIGTILPAFNGWLALNIIEGASPVLQRIERIVLGFVFGMTATMTLTFFLNVWTGLPLTLPGYLAVQGILACGLTFVQRKQGSALPTPALRVDATQLPPIGKLLLAFLGLWTAVKLIAGCSLLVALPPSYDDTVKNWNYRAEIFYVSHSVSAEYDLTGQLGAYPPAVSMTKAWYATLAGTWDEGLVALPHFLWFLATLALLFFAIRRNASRWWALLGVYLLSSVPLYFIHATAAYAEVFMGCHLFAAITLLLQAVRATDSRERRTFLRLGLVFTALLPLAKNEGLVLYLPLLLVLIAAWILLRLRRSDAALARSAIVWLAGSLLLTTLPLLLYKWSHHFVFGNAHSLGESTLTWSPLALYTIGVNLFLQGSWLILFPLLLVTLLFGLRQAFAPRFLPLTAFLLTALLVQVALFTFTKTFAAEAITQTGYSRGVVQLIPIACLWLVLMIHALLHPKTE